MQDSNPTPPQPRAVRDYDVSVIRAVKEEQRRLRFANPRLVDIGTGTAEFLVKLATDEKLLNFRLTGTDTSADMLEAAADIVRDAGLDERIQLEQNDVHQLPYADGSIEFITSQSTIYQWENPVAAFRELYRVLALNGVAIIHEPRRDLSPSMMVALKHKRAKRGLEMDSLDERLTPNEVWDLLEQAELAEYAVINSPSTAIGFEVRIARSGVGSEPFSPHVIRSADN